MSVQRKLDTVSMADLTLSSPCPALPDSSRKFLFCLLRSQGSLRLPNYIITRSRRSRRELGGCQYYSFRLGPLSSFLTAQLCVYLWTHWGSVEYFDYRTVFHG